MFVVALLLVGFGALFFLNMNNSQKNALHNDSLQPYEISPGEVVNKIKEGNDVILLDVRTAKEYQEIHLENALLLPVQDLSQATLNTIGLSQDKKDAEIIIYCRSGARSKTAYDIMKSLGYSNIKSVAGGMIHWQEDNNPFTATGEYQGVASGLSGRDENVLGPRLEFDRKTHDFGIVPLAQGIVATKFTVRNTGAEILRIGDISTSCGCTSAEISAKEILPNKNAILTVRFDPSVHPEPQEKFFRTVFISSNDPATPEAEVTISVDVAE